MKPAALVVTLSYLSLAGSLAQGLDPQHQEAAPESEKQPAVPFLERIFKQNLSPEQLAALGATPTLGRLTEAMRPEQKEAVRAKLKELEKTANDDELGEIAKGYSLLGAELESVRAELLRKHLLPEDSRTQASAAAAAYDEGRIDDALKLAAEALARDPNDETAEAIVKLARPKVRDFKISSRDPFAPGSDTRVASPNRAPTSQARALMRQATEARRAGDLDATLRAALDAMRADPTSPTVQQFYLTVIEDRAKQMRRFTETMSLLQDAADASDAGHRDRAIALGEQALASDPSPVIKKYVEGLRARPAHAEPVRPTDHSRREGSPLWPLAPLGLVAIGYGVSKSKRTWSAQEAEPASEEDSNSERIQRYRQRLKIAVASVVIGFGVVYGGPRLVRAIAPSIAAALRGGGGAIQKISTSEAGAIFPESAPAVAGETEKMIPGFSATEYQVIKEAQVILDSPEFAKLQDAYKAGRPAVVDIGGRVIQYEPDVPEHTSGMTDFGKNGFILGRKAFSSTVETQKTVLHELHRLATSQVANGVDRDMLRKEADAAQSFADRAVGVLNK